MRFYALLILLLVMVVSCKEEEPFEYPEGPSEGEVKNIIHVERDMRADQLDLWTTDRTALSCNVQGVDPAFIEYDSKQGEFLFHLIPNDSSCVLAASARTDFLDSEISDKSWDELNLEFFFSEYVSNPNTEFRLRFYYKNVELDIDLAPYIEDIGLSAARDGTIKIATDDTGTYLELSGNRINPNEDGISTNFFNTDGDGVENYLEVGVSAKDIDQQSLVLFKYMRLFSVGSE